jgi:hypothetical protein
VPAAVPARGAAAASAARSGSVYGGEAQRELVLRQRAERGVDRPGGLEDGVRHQQRARVERALEDRKRQRVRIAGGRLPVEAARAADAGQARRDDGAAVQAARRHLQRDPARIAHIGRGEPGDVIALRGRDAGREHCGDARRGGRRGGSRPGGGLGRGTGGTGGAGGIDDDDA